MTIIKEDRFLLRGGTAAALSALNEVPLGREMVYETDTGLSKVGDGVTHYNDLTYRNGIDDAPSDGTTYGRNNGVWSGIVIENTNGQLAGLNDQTGTSYTVAATDKGMDIRCTNAAAFTLYIDKQATVPVDDNFWALVSQGGAGTVTILIVPGSGVLLRTPNGAATTAAYDARGIERITGDEWRVW